MPERTPAQRQAIDQALAYYTSWLGFRQRYLRIPGVQAAVYVDDGIALSRAYGHATLDGSVQLTDTHLFRIASHSKTFTATAVFGLLQQEVLRLDDAAGRWVRDLVGSPLAAVTVRELLSHASGVYRDSSDGDFWQLRHRFPDRDQLLAMLQAPAASILPRNERFKYSNIGYGLLGLILEAAGERRYAQLVRDIIIDPLCLVNTGPELDPGRADEYATGYSALAYADERVPIDHVDTRALAPATGFYSTASDVVQYFSAHFLGDDRLIDDQSKRLMQQALWPTEKQDRHYAYGLAVTRIGERTLIGHGGGYPGHITSSVADPNDRIAISVLANAIDAPSESLAHAAVRLIDLARDTADARDRGYAGSTESLDMSRFAGRYASLWGVTDIALLGDRLYLLRPTEVDPVDNITELVALDDHTLKMTGTSGYASYGELLTFKFDDDGRARSVRGPSATTLTPIEHFSLPDRVRAPMQ